MKKVWKNVLTSVTVIAIVASLIYVFRNINWTKIASTDNDGICTVRIGSEVSELYNIEFISYDMSGIPAIYVFRMKDFAGNIYTVVDDERIAFRCLGQ